MFAEYERRLERPSDIRQHLPELFRETLVRAVLRGARVVDLGVRTGNSTAAFLAAVQVARNGRVWSYDLDVPDVPELFWQLRSWKFQQMDALSQEASDAGPAAADVVFIDLDPHSYEQTLAALRLWVPTIRPGGVVLCHDTEWPEINGVAPGSAESEVGRALDDFCAEMGGLSWENRTGCNGLGVLRVPCGHA